MRVAACVTARGTGTVFPCGRPENGASPLHRQASARQAVRLGWGPWAEALRAKGKTGPTAITPPTREGLRRTRFLRARVQLTLPTSRDFAKEIRLGVPQGPPHGTCGVDSKLGLLFGVRRAAGVSRDGCAVGQLLPKAHRQNGPQGVANVIRLAREQPIDVVRVLKRRGGQLELAVGCGRPTTAQLARPIIRRHRVRRPRGPPGTRWYRRSAGATRTRRAK